MSNEAAEPAAQGIQVPVQPYIDSLKRQLGEQAARHADELAQRDALISHLNEELSEARHMIDALAQKGS